MKVLFALLTLATVSTAAHAEKIQFVMNQFDINQESYLLPKGNISRAEVIVDSRRKTLTLIVAPGNSCPAGRMCSMMVIAPTVLNLPITYRGSPYAGGMIVVAQTDSRRVDGGLVRVQLLDDTESLQADIKQNLVNVTITEQGARDNHEIVSTMSGVRSN